MIKLMEIAKFQKFGTQRTVQHKAEDCPWAGGLARLGVLSSQQKFVKSTSV
jgi:hypothetical protein